MIHPLRQHRRNRRRRHQQRGYMNNISATASILVISSLILLLLLLPLLLFLVNEISLFPTEALILPPIFIIHSSLTPKSSGHTSLHRQAVVSKSQHHRSWYRGKFRRPVGSTASTISRSSSSSSSYPPTYRTGLLGMTTGSGNNNEQQQQQQQEEQEEQRQNIVGYVNMAVSVDGFIAGPNGELDWLNEQPPPDPNVDGNDFEDFLKSVDCMVMGSATFKVVVGFGKDVWPYGQLPIKVWTRDPSKIVIPDYLKKKEKTSSTTATKTVSTSEDGDRDQGGDGSSSFSRIGNVEARSASSPKHLFEELQKEGYRKVYIDGGKTVRDFLHAGLISRMTLSRVPILLGTGISLFGDSTSSEVSTTTTAATATTTFRSHSLKHVSTKVLTNGMVQTVYDVVCDDKTTDEMTNKPN